MLLLGGGFYFLVYSRLLHFKYIKHAIRVISGKYDDPNEPGQINHYEALTTALSGTVGMGNVSGVAVALSMGGPGAIFWMWVSAFFGVATKFFTCTLSVMYRGRDSRGDLQGGPMYVIMEGLGKNWKALALFFSVFGMIGVSPMFQTNQLVQIIGDIVLEPNGIETTFTSKLIVGLIITLFVAVVILGGIKRIGKVAGKLVPAMAVIYILSVFFILFKNLDMILPGFQLIFTQAFSNEAGIGTAPMAHGAAKTNEPVREGLVAMLGPIMDTLIICTMTALALIVTGVWNHPDFDGITLTVMAFDKVMPGIGHYILIVSVTIFSLTTMFAFPYYGAKCFSFIFGARHVYIYNMLYLASISVGATTSLGVIISVFDASYALMAIPTVVSAIILSPRVMKASKLYFGTLKTHEHAGTK